MSKRSKQRKQMMRQRSLAVLAPVHPVESLSKAARDERTAPRTVRKHFGQQFRRDSSGRYRATRSDRLRRDINVLGFHGFEPALARSSKQAQIASQHLVAVGRFLRTGD